jgi:hypothetical protein
MKNQLFLHSFYPWLLLALLCSCKINRYDYGTREIFVPSSLDLEGASVVVLVDEGGALRREPNGLAEFARLKFEAALHAAGARINAHASAGTMKRLLDEIKSNQERGTVAARLDQIGADMVFLVDVLQYHVDPGIKGACTFTMSMSLRGIDPRSATQEIFGSALARDYIAETEVFIYAQGALQLFADELRTKLTAVKSLDAPLASP